MTMAVGVAKDEGVSVGRMQWVHLPTPGDHYSAATGSAVMTVIYELTRVHEAAGYGSTIVVSRGTTAGYPPYPVGRLMEADLPQGLPSRSQRIVESACARVTLQRPFTAGMYARVPEALGREFEGTVFVHNAPAAMGLLRKGLPRARLVLYAHNQLFNSYGAREVRQVVEWADGVVCVSDFVARDICRRGGFGRRPEKVWVVLNGVDTERFAPTAVREGEPVILFLGRVVPEKGADLLLRASAGILTGSRKFKIRIVGSSNFNSSDGLSAYERELRGLAGPLGDCVEFVPFVARERVMEEYGRASIFVAPSNWDEPFGLTIAEAMACGLPCVVSRRGGIPEVAGEAALYFDPPAVEGLAKHLADLVDHPEERAALGNKARSRAMALRWGAGYEDLVKVIADL